MKVPYTNFKTRTGDTDEVGGCTFIGGEWKDVDTTEIFDNKVVVVFALALLCSFNRVAAATCRCCKCLHARLPQPQSLLHRSHFRCCPLRQFAYSFRSACRLNETPVVETRP